MEVVSNFTSAWKITCFQGVYNLDSGITFVRVFVMYFFMIFVLYQVYVGVIKHFVFDL